MMEILKDSFGGVLYNLANKNKYDTVELLQLWDSLNESEKESAGGIIKGAMQFIKEQHDFKIYDSDNYFFILGFANAYTRCKE